MLDSCASRKRRIKILTEKFVEKRLHLKQHPTLLRNPAEIRKAIKRLQGGGRLDLAVAFVGADWWELLAGHRGKLRLICWLASTNTNPYAVEDLMNRPNTEVRQRTSMHAKVYFAPGAGAIVGSANLSKAALSDAEISGQDEAAALVHEPAFLSTVRIWFVAMWNDTDRTIPIKSHHLSAAKEAWEKTKTSSGAGGQRSAANGKLILPPLPHKIDPRILTYAKRARRLDLERSIGECREFTRSLEPSKLSRDDCRGIVDHFVSWTGHRASYDTFLSQPLPLVKRGLTVLFDDGIDTETRLDQTSHKGYLTGLRIPSISLLLYWRNPYRFVPYNFRTIKFLQDFGMQESGMSASSGRCYVKWLRWATRLAQQLNLPTPGHIDRMVEFYYEDHYVNNPVT
jgi:hypothetical protein